MSGNDRSTQTLHTETNLLTKQWHRIEPTTPQLRCGLQPLGFRIAPRIINKAKQTVSEKCFRQQSEQEMASKPGHILKGKMAMSYERRFIRESESTLARIRIQENRAKFRHSRGSPAIRGRESTGRAPKSVDERNSSFVQSFLHVRRASRRGLGLDDCHPLPKPRVTRLRGSYATDSIAYKYHPDTYLQIIKPPRHSVHLFSTPSHQFYLVRKFVFLLLGFVWVRVGVQATD